MSAPAATSTTLLWVTQTTASPRARPGNRFLRTGPARPAAWARTCLRRNKSDFRRGTGKPVPLLFAIPVSYLSVLPCPFLVPHVSACSIFYKTCPLRKLYFLCAFIIFICRASFCPMAEHRTYPTRICPAPFVWPVMILPQGGEYADRVLLLFAIFQNRNANLCDIGKRLAPICH